MDGKKQDVATGIPVVGGEFRNLKQHGSATVVELREFVAQMRGKSPREMLGAVAESGLVRATIQATIGCVILTAIFTVGPYYVWGGKAEAKPAGPAKSVKDTSNSTAQTPDKNDPVNESGSANASTGGSAKTAKSKNGELPGPDDLEKAAKKLGIGEAKSADPKVNPLDKDLDFLLDKK